MMAKKDKYLRDAQTSSHYMSGSGSLNRKRAKPMILKKSGC